jgi:hypothetical protein
MFSSNRTFQRTLVNIRPFRASRTPPPPHHDMLSLAPLDPGTIVAVRRTEDLAAPFDLARVTLTTETHVSLAYLGTTNQPLSSECCLQARLDRPHRQPHRSEGLAPRPQPHSCHRRHQHRGPARPPCCHPPHPHRSWSSQLPVLPNSTPPQHPAIRVLTPHRLSHPRSNSFVKTTRHRPKCFSSFRNLVELGSFWSQTTSDCLVQFAIFFNYPYFSLCLTFYHPIVLGGCYHSTCTILQYSRLL